MPTIANMYRYKSSCLPPWLQVKHNHEHQIKEAMDTEQVAAAHKAARLAQHLLNVIDT